VSFDSRRTALWKYLHTHFAYVFRWLDEAKNDSVKPWYLQDPPRLGRRDSVLVYGAMRRVLLRRRAVFRVFRRWWTSEHDPEVLSNGSMLVSTAMGGSIKPVLWVSSVVFAGVVGLQFASTNSNASFVREIRGWQVIALWLFGFALAVQWWKSARRLRREFARWQGRCRKMSAVELDTEDQIVFGYVVGEDFRRRLKASGIVFFVMTTYCLIALALLHPGPTPKAGS
jgi:hypothetical protein